METLQPDNNKVAAERGSMECEFLFVAFTKIVKVRLLGRQNTGGRLIHLFERPEIKKEATEGVGLCWSKYCIIFRTRKSHIIDTVAKCIVI